MFTGISNKDELETTPLRKKALEILEAGYRAIDTATAINRSVFVSDNVLQIKDQEISLADIQRIHVIGFGKAACEAAAALENKLGETLTSGVAIDVGTKTCQLIETYEGDHPTPTQANVKASEHVVELADSVGSGDLVLVAVSGGGSSLLCWPASECEQSQNLYDSFLSAGGTITELNTVRKHLSQLKGGGLAKRLHPAKVVGLIFSDVPGGELADVASGPTFFDDSTVADAETILKKYGIQEKFTFFETPKDKKYFSQVTNVAIVTNKTAFSAMSKAAQDFDLTPKIISTKMYDFAAPTIERFVSETNPGEVAFGGGEIRLIVDSDGGSGGRNQYLANEALHHIDSENKIFISSASDGIDNSDAAGAIADHNSLEKIKEAGLDYVDYLSRYDSYHLFEKTDGLIFTGATGANVADIMLYINYE